jgi:threonine dehydrogenase-like Zn-dependent dehydrogenase
VQALVFRYSLPRLAAARIIGALSPAAYVGPFAPFRLEDVPVPSLPADDWLLVRVVQCGLCGSDAKQVFLRGDRDNPLTSLVSFPHVLGHEAAGVVSEAGPAVRARRPGDRVMINPWLSCAPRGLEPCSACVTGDYPLCERFAEGRFAPGIHAGNCRDVSGGFAEYIAVHESQTFPVPEGMTWDAAVLADPFSVSLHSVLQYPPPPGAPALVYGCGTLGLLAIAVLRMLSPATRVLAIARYAHQQDLALAFGAHEVLPSGGDALVERIAEVVGTKPLRPWSKRAWLLRGAGVVYDTVGSPATVEMSLRVAAPRSKVVVSGVEAPRRFEWTPLYFKEVAVVGSNAFGVEPFEGDRKHAMEIYAELWRRGLDVTSLITHRFPLERYREAFMTHARKGASRVVKAVFTFPDNERTN